MVDYKPSALFLAMDDVVQQYLREKFGDTFLCEPDQDGIIRDVKDIECNRVCISREYWIRDEDRRLIGMIGLIHFTLKDRKHDKKIVVSQTGYKEIPRHGHTGKVVEDGITWNIELYEDGRQFFHEKQFPAFDKDFMYGLYNKMKEVSL